MFANTSALSASFEGGKTWISTFRKQIGGTATVVGQWYDYSYAGGNPIANYYASSPLEAQVLDASKGIIVPRMETTARQYLHRMTVMASGPSFGSSNHPLMLCDYLLFYPFIDMDAAGEDQVMAQTETLPRYADGRGLQMIVVAQSPTVGGGRFTITYTDANDVLRTTESMFCGASQPAGALAHATGATTGVVAFVPMPAGATGVKRVESVNFSVANGGLCAVVIVRPLQAGYINDESRRAANDSFGDSYESEMMRTRGGIVELKDGAFLGLLGQCVTSSIASVVLTGTIETVWS